MYLTLLAAALAPVAVLANPQYGGGPTDAASSSTSASSSTTSGSAAPSASAGNQIIQVFPNQKLVFQPNNIVAKENDTITFIFPASSITHSVTQSNFSAPCNLLNENGGGPIGFDSGLQQDAQFSIVITNASQPIWFFCKQFGPPSHCGSGMVGAINAPTSGPNTFANYLAGANKLGTSQPQDTHSGSLVGLAASATGPVASGTVPPTASGTGPASPSGSKQGGALQLSAGGIPLLVSLGLAFFI